MKSHPVLFSGDMVRAILEGRKTQTRRPVKQAMRFAELGVPAWRPDWCPLGVPGDELWVRETFWSENETCDHEFCNGCDVGPYSAIGPCDVDYCATPQCSQPPTPVQHQTVRQHIGQVVPGYWWLAPPDRTGESESQRESHGEWVFIPWRWSTKIPSIHMPRWASRITLKVTDVRVQRLMDASEADIIAEGFTNSAGYQSALMKAYGDGITYANPWMWAVTFEVKS